MANVYSETEMRHRGWTLAAGVMTLGLGVLTFLSPLDNPIRLSFALASLLLTSALIELTECFEYRRDPSLRLRSFRVLIPFIVGLMFWNFPNGGTPGIGLGLGIYFYLSSAIRAAIASQLRPAAGWMWIMTSAAIAILLGTAALQLGPATPLSAPRTLLGIDLLAIAAERFAWIWSSRPRAAADDARETTIAA